MIVTTDVIETAIAHHAVLLNRPGWLNPDHLDLQRTVWLDLVTRFECGRIGRLHVDDFAAAVVECLDAESSAQNVLPSNIVTGACGFAARRGRLAGERVNQDPAMLIYTETVHLMEGVARARGEGPDVVAGVIAQFNNDVDQVKTLLIDSGYPDDVMRPLLERIDTLAVDALDKIDSQPTLHAPVEKPSMEDVAKVEELMRNGVN